MEENSLNVKPPKKTIMEVVNTCMSFIGICVIILLLVILVVWLLVMPTVKYIRFPTEFNELRIYICLFLFMFGFLVFGILRLYNSIVKNTLFLVRLREVIVSMLRILPKLKKSIQDNNTSSQNLKTSLERLSKEVDKIADEITEKKK